MRLRIRFSKLGKVRFTSHRDVARIWERALRRAELPVAYSAGFSPRPKLSFGLALPTGYESVAEYLDVELDAPADLEPHLLASRLTDCLPPGFEVLAAAGIEPATMSLQQAVTSCTWRIDVTGLQPERAVELVDRLLEAEVLTVTRERKGKQVIDDLRPAVLYLSVVGPTPGGAELEVELATQPRGVRPAELLTTLSPELGEALGRRAHQWIWSDGARVEPLPVTAGLAGATSAPHAEVRAS